MDRKIKLIWDFHGGHAKGTADHHSIHLGEYATREKVMGWSSLQRCIP
jgi:hypothetical protein